MIYACSILSLTRGSKVDVTHTAIKIDAKNYLEAVGIGTLVGKRVYPNDEIHIQVNDDEQSVTKDNIESVNLI